MISFPTGGVKKNESPVDAAAREFLEETGYTARAWLPITHDPIVDFADKTDGGEHYVFWAIGAVRVQEPKNPEQRVVLADKTKMLQKIIPRGVMPAMSMAAFLALLRSVQ